jgi:xylose dehydrogenase (NAD/NADP)
MDVSAYFEEFTRRDWQTRADGTVRLGVVGLGGFACTRALPAIQAADMCEVTVLVSGTPEKAHRVAAEFDVDRSLDYEAFTAGAATGDYDAVYVATPPAYHRRYTEAAARLGKHVLCEKPLATGVPEAERMVEACTDHGVTLMTAYRLRTEPAVRRAREMIRDGIVGEPVQFRGGFSRNLLDDVGTDTWRLDPDVAGGGALLDLGVYPLNVARFLLDSDPVAVRAETTSRSPPFDRVDEHVAALLSFQSGVTASCTASFNAHPANTLRVLGTDGMVLVHDPFGGDIPQELVVEHGEARTTHVGPAVDEVREEFDYFAHCVLTGTDCETDGQDGLTDLRIIEAAYESATAGERVAV